MIATAPGVYIVVGTRRTDTPSCVEPRRSPAPLVGLDDDLDNPRPLRAGA